MDNLVQQFIIMWAVIDPIVSIPVFLAMAMGRSRSQQLRLAVYATSLAAGVLLFFVLVGQTLLESMDIPLSAFQIAGGIVLFLFALTMIFGDSKPEEEMLIVDKGISSAVFPLAIPSIASPGAMLTAVLLTDNHRFSLVDQSLSYAVMLLVLLATLILLWLATYIHRIIGDTGASVISRVMGLLLAAVATNSVLVGLKSYFGIVVGG